MKKILVIGGGAYQVPLIKRIKERGYEAYCVDGNASALGSKYADGFKHIDIMDKNECLSYAKEMRINAVMTYGATITLPTVSYIGERLSLPCLPYDTAELSKSKYKIKRRLADAGCNIKGDFFEFHSVEEAKKQKITVPCVIKPSDGSGSKGVTLVENEAELENAIEYAFENARFGEFYSEALVKGDEYTVEAFVAEGETYVYCIVKTTFERNENGEISYGHRTPSGLSEETEKIIADEVKKAVKALGITMLSVNFDVILSEADGKPYIIDCGIRVGQNLIASHFVPLSRGVSVIDRSIDIALGEKADCKPLFNKCIATRLLIYKSGVITEIKPMDDIIGKNGIVDVVMRKGVGDVQKPYKEKSDTCGWVITQGQTPDEAEEKAQKAKKIIEDYIIIKPIEV
ncbi:MAG: ATP-grasp domain-containing protein [Acutalibacteraceae bacterium]|nr:ATP-grasp domain-containing protein [Acutalibacteraceae bacterium]